MHYQIQAPAQRCAVTNRELKPGEPVYSVLFDRGATLERQDFSAEAWQGPPAGAFSFWRGRVPARDQSPRLQFDPELLLDCFQRLEAEAEPQKVNFRYILALLLMRHKRLKFEEMRAEGGAEWLVLRDAKARRSHRVRDPHLTDEQLAAVQDEVFKVLGLA
jgi:hypothetical protein